MCVCVCVCVSVDPYYLQILYLQISLKFSYNLKINTCIAFVVICRQAQDCEKFESFNMHVPS